MFLKAKIRGENADKISYIIGKNPNNVFISSERCVISNVVNTELGKIIALDGTPVNLWDINPELIPSDVKKQLSKDTPDKYTYFVRGNNLIRKRLGNGIETYLTFKKYEPQEVEFVMFSIPDTLVFGQDFEGYVNEREYLVSSIFMMEINDNIRSAFSKEGDLYDTIFDVELELGPVKPNLQKEKVITLFEEAGFVVEYKPCNTDISFTVQREEVVFLTLRKSGMIREILKKLVVLMNTVDNFSYFRPTQDNLEKIKKYTEGWVDTHSLRGLIINRNLSYTGYAKQLIQEIEDKQEKPVKEENIEEQIEKGYGENGETLNETRMRTMKELILGTEAKTVLDLGCGEGKLLRILAFENIDKLVGIDSSSKCVFIANKNLDIIADKKKEGFRRPEVLQSSLYYKDSRLKGFDTIVLCEVIEHIDYPRIFEVIDNIMWLEPKNFILSTPNKEFNRFFTKGETLKNGLRHYDHRFEFTREEFQSFCNNVALKYGYSCSIINYGKIIDGIAPTMASVFKREGN